MQTKPDGNVMAADNLRHPTKAVQTWSDSWLILVSHDRRGTRVQTSKYAKRDTAE